MNRWLLALPAAVAVVAACAPPAPERLHGREAFEVWLIANGVRQEKGDLSSYSGQPCGGYLSRERVAVTDDACIDRWTEDPQAHIWIPVHEAGHAVDYALASPQGATPVGFEEGAQCVAEVVLGWSYQPPGGAAAGYWDCPDDQVNRTRTLMETIGAF